jgi:hypothetical protein
LKRAAPFLNKLGIEITFEREPRTRKRIITINKIASEKYPSSPVVADNNKTQTAPQPANDPPLKTIGMLAEEQRQKEQNQLNQANVNDQTHTDKPDQITS